MPMAWLEAQFNLAEDAYTKPDIVVRPAAVRSPDLTGESVLLVIEVADSSLAYDQGAKALLYAQYGVREYWVVDVRTLATRVHREPGPQGYGQVVEIAADDLLMPLLVPALAVRLADLSLE